MGEFSIWHWLIVMMLIYPLPSVVAFARHHQNRVAILLINLITGFTMIGWVVAMVWALTAVIPVAPPQRTERRQRVEPTIR